MGYLLKLLLSHEVVLPSVYLSLPRPAGGVADAEFEELGVLVDEPVDDGALSVARLTFPTPEHPVMTRGLCLTMSLW